MPRTMRSGTWWSISVRSQKSKVDKNNRVAMNFSWTSQNILFEARRLLPVDAAGVAKVHAITP